MSRRSLFIFLNFVLFISFTACRGRIDIKTEPESAISENEKVANVFEDDASFKASNYFLKKAISDYLKEGHWERAIQNYIKLGNGFVKMGDLKSALEYMNKGLDLAMEHSGYEYSILAKSYHRIAFGFMKEKKFEKAVEIYRKALDLKITVFGKYHREVSKTYNSISLAYRNMGDFEKADNFYYKSLLIKLKRFEKIDENFFRGFKFVDRSKVKKRLYGEAKKVLSKSLKVYLETYGGYNNLTAVIFENIGIIYAMEGSYERSLKNFRSALRIRIRLFGDKSLEVADTLHDIGVTLSLRGNSTDAEKYLNESLQIKITKTGPSHLFTGDTYFQLGKLYFNLGKFTISLKYFQHSLNALNKKFKSGEIYETPDLSGNIDFKSDLLNILEYKAKSFVAIANIYGEKLKDLKASLSTYFLCVRIVEMLRDQYQDGEYSSYFNNISQEILKDAVELSYRLFKLTGDEKYKQSAFVFSEKSKASILIRMISDSNAKKFSGIPESLLIKERKLKKRIVDLQLDMEKEKMRRGGIVDGNYKKLESGYFQTKKDYKLLLTKFEKEYKNYYLMKHRKKVIDPSRFRKSLSKKAAVLEYYITGKSIFIFFLSNTEFLIKRTDLPKEFGKIINTLYISMEKIEEDIFYDSARFLYDLLIEPFYENLRKIKKIIIIPHGELFLIPFEVLIKNNKKNSSFSLMNYLVTKFSVSYHYSLSIRNFNKEKDMKNKGNFVGFAPVFNWDTSSLPDAGRVALPKLPGTDIEVRSIVKLFKENRRNAEGNFYENANESRLKNKLSKGRIDFIHIATHTVINRDNPNLSGLIFSRSEYSPDDEDGILYLGEIYNLKLDSNLLVLSGCESGMGKIMEGEGILALSRGFLYAGTRNIIFSLLKVEDKSTRKLMINFYKNVLKGFSFDEALRNSKLELVKDPYTAFPKYWGGFILFGK